MARVIELNKDKTVLQPPPLRLCRVFHARRETVFKAWSSADHVKRWFSPETYFVSDAKVQMRVGGPFEVCMRSTNGEKHWTRGTFVEVAPHSRLVIDMRTTDNAGEPLFRAYTEVDFCDAPGGTRMEVVQTYTFNDPSIAMPMVAGAQEGWRTTLDKLEKEVVRMRGRSRDRRPLGGACHLPFGAYLRRTGRAGMEVADRSSRPSKSGLAAHPVAGNYSSGTWMCASAASERLKGRWEGGVISTFDATYYDVIPNERLVYGYEMHLDDRKISVSLATVQLKAEGGKTTLKVSEQGAFLDGYDDAGSREHGTGHLLDALGASLKD